MLEQDLYQMGIHSLLSETEADAFLALYPDEFNLKSAEDDGLVSFFDGRESKARSFYRAYVAILPLLGEIETLRKFIANVGVNRQRLISDVDKSLQNKFRERTLPEKVILSEYERRIKTIDDSIEKGVSLAYPLEHS